MYGDARPLFVVTEIVIAGLIIWVGYVLLKLREPWVRATSLAPSAAQPGQKLADEKIAAEPEKADDSDAQADKPKND
jgi:chorismate-pyruvate lyase